MTLALFFSIISLCTASVWAAPSLPVTHSFIYGGSGDPASKKNIFTEGFVQLTQRAKSLGWKNDTVLFDGDHPAAQTEVLRSLGTPNMAHFNRDSFDESLKRIQQKITSGEIKKGDQVLIVINSHGIENAGENTHTVSCGSEAFCDLDRLSTVLKQLENLDAKPAVVDLSCYSGNTLKLGSAKTCVVSASGQKDVSFTAFAGLLAEQFKKGVSLEQAYLTARQQDYFSFPQISTDIGQDTEKIIKQLAGNPFFDRNEKALRADTEASHCVFCGTESKEATQVQDLSALNSKAMAGISGLQNFAQASNNYWKYYAEVEELRQQVLKESKNIVQAGQYQQNWYEFATTDYAKQIEMYSKVSRPDKITKMFLDLSKKFQEQKKKLRKNPDFMSYVAKLELLLEKTDIKRALSSQKNSLAAEAYELAKEERKIYSQIYNNLQSKKGNPCANFIF